MRLHFWWTDAEICPTLVQLKKDQHCSEGSEGSKTSGMCVSCTSSTIELWFSSVPAGHSTVGEISQLTVSWKAFVNALWRGSWKLHMRLPPSLINNSVYAFLIPPMNAQQSVLSHLTFLHLFTLSASIPFVDRHSFRLISEMSPVWAWVEVRQAHRVYRINLCFLLPSPERWSPGFQTQLLVDA